MNTFKKAVVVITLLSVQVSYAKPPPMPTPAPAPATFEVNPTSLRERLLESNVSLKQALLSVKDAKDQVSQAQGRLLPAINLSAMVSHTFFLSAVQFLLPFLIPSNWFNYNAQKNSFEAEKLSYLIMELNVYSSALSLYYTVRADMATQQLYQDNAEKLKAIVQVGGSAVLAGNLASQDLLATSAQADLAGAQALQIKETVDTEKAAIRHMLGLPLSTDITYANVDLPATPWETMDIQAAVDLANKIAPEHKQIDFLVKAAQQRSWSAKFGWITNATLGNSSATQNVGLSNMSGVASFGFGFDLGPTISLADRAIVETQILQTVLEQTNTQVLETAINSFKDVQGQLALATDGEGKAKQIYDITVLQFSLGTGRFVDLLTAYTQVVTASASRINAQEGVNLQRVVLNRMSLGDQFAQIKGCTMTTPPGGKKASLDQLCRAPGH